MITQNLLDTILLDPVNPDKGTSADTLYIVSGYASATMAFTHTKLLDKFTNDFSIHLIIGMASLSGILDVDHKGFLQLTNDLYPDKFSCSYIDTKISVHAKAYAWFKEGVPKTGFVGSGNYSQAAFKSKNRKELFVEANPSKIKNFFDELIPSTIYCNHQDAEQYITRPEYEKTDDVIDEKVKREFDKCEKVTLSFLQKTRNPGEVHNQDGLNWGQRKARKNKNEATIPVRCKEMLSDFFPEMNMHFYVETDDNKELLCSRVSGKYGKSIVTPTNNSLMGEYFRGRLGVASEAFVTKEHLITYGRTDVDFYKIDDEIFYMDFSVD